MLPVSVVVSHSKKHEDWFLYRCLPSILENDPAQIIIEDGDEDPQDKRNLGLLKATQPYHVFADDHTVMYEWALGRLLGALQRDTEASFAHAKARIVDYAGDHKSFPWFKGTMVLIRTGYQFEKGIYVPEVLFELHEIPVAVEAKDPLPGQSEEGGSTPSR